MDYAYISICKVTCVLFTIFSIAVPVLSELLLREVQNLRTVIVTADIHRGLQSPAPSTLCSNSVIRQLTESDRAHSAWHPPCLTFRHWSGVTPYTSSYEFAGSCVFGKQLSENLSLRPTYCYAGRPYPEVTAACLPSSLRSSHSFALVYST